MRIFHYIRPNFICPSYSRFIYQNNLARKFNCISSREHTALALLHIPVDLSQFRHHLRGDESVLFIEQGGVLSPAAGLDPWPVDQERSVEHHEVVVKGAEAVALGKDK